MQQSKQGLLLIIVFILSMQSSAQTAHENTGWFAWFSSYKIAGPWSLYFDGQVRSADDWNNIRNILIRPGVTYVINPKNTVTIGYAYVITYTQAGSGSKNTLGENRIWEQYIYNTNFGRSSLQNRFRLEQRFIERQTEQVFAQRLRYFVRTIIPFAKPKDSFSNGFFGAIQNEIFLNIQNKEKINSSLFDQNRLYIAVGYRLNKKIDLETGYMNQYIKGMTSDVSNNIIQLALYTRL